MPAVMKVSRRTKSDARGKASRCLASLRHRVGTPLQQCEEGVGRVVQLLGDARERTRAGGAFPGLRASAEQKSDFLGPIARQAWREFVEPIAELPKLHLIGIALQAC